VMSARPGRIIADLANPASRPRDIQFLSEPSAAALSGQIRAHLTRAYAMQPPGIAAS
jgi:hypothetical protein